MRSGETRSDTDEPNRSTCAERISSVWGHTTLLDDDLFTTPIDENSEQLGLVGSTETVIMSWCNNQVKEEPVAIAEVRIQGRGAGCERLMLHGVRAVLDLLLPRQSLRLTDLRSRFLRLTKIPLEEYDNVQPKLLIRLSNAKVTKTLRTVGIADNAALVSRTPLGWVKRGQESILFATMTSNQISVTRTSRSEDRFASNDFTDNGLNLHDDTSWYRSVE